MKDRHRTPTIPVVIESTLIHLPPKDEPVDVSLRHKKQELFARRTLSGQSRKRRIVLPVLLLLFIGVSLVGVLSLLQTATAEIHITPTTLDKSVSFTLFARSSPGNAQELRASLHARSKQVTGLRAQATGTRVIAARQAHGLLVFYNQAATSVLVPAGTSFAFTGNTHLHIILDRNTIVPVGSLPASGEASGPAHVQEAGPQGNIQAGMLDQLCACGENGTPLRVVNQAFTGGTPAGTQPLLLKQDIDQATVPVQGSLVQRTRAELLSAVRDMALTPPACDTLATSVPPAGSTVDSASVTLLATCSLWTVNREALQAHIAAALSTGPFAPGDRHFRLVHWMLSSALHTAAAPGQGFRLEGRVRTTWVYRFDPASLEHIAHLVAGQTQDRALQLLTRLPGVAHATISYLVVWIPLPTTPQRIHFSLLPY